MSSIDSKALLSLYLSTNREDLISIKALALFIHNHLFKVEDIPVYWDRPIKLSKLLLRSNSLSIGAKLLSSVESALSNYKLSDTIENALDDSEDSFQAREAEFIQRLQNPIALRKESAFVDAFYVTKQEVTIIKDTVDYRDRENVFEANIKDPSRFRRRS